ncbi:MAG TPA: DnaJ domain-containing protein [Thermoanaerobaculia bacterium]|nr:DnaJ domain-containing protein [Thermoanaerobaculia bacterium]
MKVNYYEVLGVSRSAAEPEIREKFRKLARENHPDRYRGTDKEGAERKFQTLTEALNVLTSPTKRKQHDAELSPGAAASPATDFAQVARAYMSHGVKAYKEGNYQAAYENFDMAVKHNPNDAKAQHSLALAASRIPSLLRQAVQAAEAAAQREAYNVVYLKDAGLFCRKAGLDAKAERYLQQAVELDPSNVEVQTALAEIRKTRETKEAPKKGILDSLFKKG